MTRTKIVILIALAVGAGGAAWLYSLGTANPVMNYSRALDVINAYDGRNGAVVYYFERVRGDAVTAAKVRDQAAEARKIGDSLRADFALAQPLPFTDTRKQFDRYIEIQCAISKTVTDETFRKSPAWTQVSQRTEIYHRTVRENFNLYERTFGTNKLLFRDCP